MMFGMKKKSTPSSDVMGGWWGNKIEWFDWERRRVVGWKQERPKVGDYLYAQMQSGKWAKFRYTEVDLKWDPPDMFFGTVKDIGYCTEQEALADDGTVER